MPEGPSVKKFSLLASPFVGQVVAKVGGSSKRINLQNLKELRFQDCQVHGKNLFLAFGSDEREIVMSQHPERGQEETALEEVMGTGRDGITLSKIKGQEPKLPSTDNQQQEAQESNYLEPAEDPWKWLHFHFWLFGSIRANEFARARSANKRGDWKDPVPRLVLHFDGGGFLAFYNCRMAWCSGPTIKPTCDILSVQFHQGQALEALCQPRPVCCILLDQRYFSGLGNIIKNEILYMAKIHPLSQGSHLKLENVESLLNHALRFSSNWLHNKLQGKRLHYQIYMKEVCPLGHRVLKESLGPPRGLKRLTWWCPECQFLYT
ncbi:endonuclease 8-like 2 [Rhinatrema bivittatum]|uniref:endonuclease 8-like 2 n=1 Tax=Rhinatrema bivittatum TaxID=194408 RepID=UPI001129365D|nr:endonuclease 8-like 2 [Rhinatrema bivittatum]XP_029451992.1 endonuclease 8-like 2 [Rhinatrema bivittatum]XP_029451993.1 endonuclease 8-like 2 [Rhinatrema bivittatum]XP_029451994.1 endonuclease 8-like 2 [Rhinatrema bivittatum]XP_029451995.1 endonuclease 8-like 2 [Rhinatrema bivittatum]XP_029451996.1 endonuclease 8-like 2 [Rhinatrema bivittatum]XP_029451997.1 endonuclease 8-like 2 [Rhinatrema bivittatum]XP_029451998.1 endonuclease 8-like 2 [Rhinatrema bivittatum]